MSKMDEIQRQLIEDFSNYIEVALNFSPLTSKIYSYLLVDISEDGVTFDELVEIFNVSKSSVSSSLSFLTQLKYIEYNIKIDDRRRFYRTVPHNMIIRLQGIHDTLANERDLSKRLRDYKLEKANDRKDISMLISSIYIEHLDRAVYQLNETIEKLKILNKKQLVIK